MTKKTYIQLIEQDTTYDLIHRIMDFLKLKTNYHFKSITNELGEEVLSTEDLPKDKLNEIETALTTLGGDLNFNRATSAYGTRIVITEISPDIADQETVENSVDSQLTELTEHLSQLQVDNSNFSPVPSAPPIEKESVTEPMHAAPIAPFHSHQTSALRSFNTFPARPSNQIDFSDSTNVVNLFHQAETSELSVYKNKILMDFSKNKIAAEILMNEYICRGARSELEQLLNVECDGQVTKKIKTYSVTQHDSNQNNRQVTQAQSTQTESYSYQLRVNFDLETFAHHIKRKKSNSTDSTFLGLREDVLSCIELINGKATTRTNALMSKLDTLNAYNSYDKMFDFGF